MHLNIPFDYLLRVWYFNATTIMKFPTFFIRNVFLVEIRAFDLAPFYNDQELYSKQQAIQSRLTSTTNM